MAAIDDLVAQIEDPALRERLAREVAELQRTRKFGLVFEHHLPELLPIYSATPRPGDLVGKRGEALTETWLVLKIERERAHAIRRGEKKAEVLALSEVVVVRQFGDPIFPALVPMDKVQNGLKDAPWHTLIEADNYHALQLLEYLYAGQVDCIYIDPPYNTGARDWKYNNDYIDANDGWRHSKWLAFMQRRLRLAKRLLKPDTGVLIVTVDEHELHHLGMLLEQLFAEANRQLVTIVINQKGVAQGRLSRAEEYAIYCFNPGVTLAPQSDDLLSPDRGDTKRFQSPRWEWLLRGGTNSRREDRPGLFFPIHIDPNKRKIVEIGEPLPLGKTPDSSKLSNRTVAWPLRTDGSLGNWRVSPPTLRILLSKGYVRLGGFDEARRTWTILYLGQKAQTQIANGVVEIVGRDEVTGEVEVKYVEAQQRSIKTVWHRATHDAGNYGSNLLRSILGEGGKFSFPKSIYAVLDAVSAVVRDRPQALIIDFFAGSGTTLNAVNLMNCRDGGQRRCILVTNNEVSGDEAEELALAKHRPTDEVWEAQGICRNVTWPRCKYTILGKRDDGSKLPGHYLTGKRVDAEKPRQFTHIGFLDGMSLDTPAKKQLVGLIDGLPQTLVEGDCPFIVSEDYPVSLLFDDRRFEEWLEALDGQGHITQFVIITPAKRHFDELRILVNEVLGPSIVSEDLRRPLQEGFPANLEYFRLDFLDKDQVALKRRFREILPMLWMRAGCVGPRPTMHSKKPEPAFLLPDANTFAVLLDEMRFPEFSKLLAKRKDLTHVFLVTDSHEAFEEMAAKVKAPTVIQLYRDYLENFLINRGDLG